MHVHELTVMIGTDQPDALARFYGDILGLQRVPRFDDPVFLAAGAHIRILRHSAIAGPTPQPARIQINLFVHDVRTEWARIAPQGVPFVREPTLESWGGVVATMQDPDGNYVQLVQFDAPS